MTAADLRRGSGSGPSGARDPGRQRPRNSLQSPSAPDCADGPVFHLFPIHGWCSTYVKSHCEKYPAPGPAVRTLVYSVPLRHFSNRLIQAACWCRSLPKLRGRCPIPRSEIAAVRPSYAPVSRQEWHVWTCLGPSMWSVSIGCSFGVYHGHDVLFDGLVQIRPALHDQGQIGITPTKVHALGTLGMQNIVGISFGSVLLLFIGTITKRAVCCLMGWFCRGFAFSLFGVCFCPRCTHRVQTPLRCAGPIPDARLRS